MHNLINTTSPVQTMSTREIASLIGRRHLHIKASAERLAARGVITTGPSRGALTSNNQVCYEYHLNKRDSLILVAQNCPEFTARIIDRWQELEAQIEHQKRMNQIPNFADPVASAHAWIAEHEDKLLAIDEHRAVKDSRGFGDSWATINEVRKALGGGKFLWQRLSEWCTENGIERKPVKLTTGTQSFAYPSSAWLHVYGIKLSDVFADRVDAIGRGVSINYKLAIN